MPALTSQGGSRAMSMLMGSKGTLCPTNAGMPPMSGVQAMRPFSSIWRAKLRSPNTMMSNQSWKRSRE